MKTVCQIGRFKSLATVVSRVFSFVLALVVSACASVAPSPTPGVPAGPTYPGPTSTIDCGDPCALFFENRGGPAFDVLIGGKPVATVGCPGGIWLTAGTDPVPPLPWDVGIVRVRDGSTIANQHIDVLPQWSVQIGEEFLGFSKQPILGPAGPTCPPELSRDVAVELARTYTNLETLVYAKAGRFSNLDTTPADRRGEAVNPDQVVWAIAFSGDIEICPPPPAAPASPSDCFLRPGTATVFLDYATGAFRETQVYAPG